MGTAMSVLILLMATLPAEGPRHLARDLVVERPADIPPRLETIDGRLVLDPRTEGLDFPHLTDVTGDVHITLAGAGRARFPALERVHGGLELELRGSAEVELPRLEHVSGPIGLDLDPAGPGTRFPRLARHEAGLWVFGGGDFERLFPALEAVWGTVFVQPTGPCRALLGRLERVGGHLVLSNVGHLAFSGLDALTRVDGGVYLFGGSDLALPSLERVQGALAVRDSRARDLSSVGRPGARLGALLLRDNPRLDTWPTHLEVSRDRVRVDGSPALARPARGSPRSRPTDP
jgi:hypothetical protein